MRENNFTCLYLRIGGTPKRTPSNGKQCAIEAFVQKESRSKLSRETVEYCKEENTINNRFVPKKRVLFHD